MKPKALSTVKALALTVSLALALRPHPEPSQVAAIRYGSAARLQAQVRRRRDTRRVELLRQAPHICIRANGARSGIPMCSPASPDTGRATLYREHLRVAVTNCSGGCSPRLGRLQSHVAAAAAPGRGGCSPRWWRLPPHLLVAAAPSGGGCSPTCGKLLPCLYAWFAKPSWAAGAHRRVATCGEHQAADGRAAEVSQPAGAMPPSR